MNAEARGQPREASPSERSRIADSASHSRPRCDECVEHGFRSKVERLITFSTSAVAVCCWWRDVVLAQLIEQPRVLDGDHGLGREVL